MTDLVQELLTRISAHQVEPSDRESIVFSANEDVFLSNSAGLTRASQALEAAADPSTEYAEFEHDTVRLWVGSPRISAQHTDFVLVLLGLYGVDEPKLELVAGIRLYSDTDEELEALSTDPSLALATVVARYGAEYQIEGGKRFVLEPLVVFDRGRFVLPGRVEPSEIMEALDLPTGIDIQMITLLRVMPSGELKLFFPIVLRAADYAADVRANRH